MASTFISIEVLLEDVEMMDTEFVFEDGELSGKGVRISVVSFL